MWFLFISDAGHFGTILLLRLKITQRPFIDSSIHQFIDQNLSGFSLLQINSLHKDNEINLISDKMTY